MAAVKMVEEGKAPAKFLVSNRLLVVSLGRDEWKKWDKRHSRGWLGQPRYHCSGWMTQRRADG